MTEQATPDERELRNRPCPHCGVRPADTADPMGSLVACLRAVVDQLVPQVAPVPAGWDRIEGGPSA